MILKRVDHADMVRGREYVIWVTWDDFPRSGYFTGFAPRDSPREARSPVLANVARPQRVYVMKVEMAYDASHPVFEVVE